MIETGLNQDACLGATFSFSYSGSATSTAVFATSTVLGSSLNPSAPGQQVTFTATVNVTGIAPGPTTGAVAFFDGATPITCAAGSVAFNGTTATCLVTFGAAGTHTITAVFSNSDGNFTGSTSPVFTQTVQSSANCVSSTPTGTVTTISSSVSGNYTVANGTTLVLNGGTITGNVTVNATGKFIANGGTVKGNVSSSGGPVLLLGTTVTGNLEATNAALDLGAGTHVSGTVQVTGGTTFCSSGTTGSPVQIGTNVQIQSLGASANPVTICNTQVGGNFTYQSNAAAVVIGGSAACLGNTIGGNFTVQSNSGHVTIGPVSGSGYGNTVKGSIVVQKNTGGGTLTANKAGTTCSLSGDTPGIVGTLNTAVGKNTCNATA